MGRTRVTVLRPAVAPCASRLPARGWPRHCGGAWYEAERSGRGARFEAAVQTLERLIAEHHEAFPVIRGQVRRTLLRRFPCALYYQPLDVDTAEVIACLHTPATAPPLGG